MVNYFKIKYLIYDCFYYEVYINERTYSQAAGICQESFLEYINSDGIESIIARASIILLKYRHKVRISDNDINSMEYIIDKTKEFNLNDYLSDDVIEYFEEEIDFIKEKRYFGVNSTIT